MLPATLPRVDGIRQRGLEMTRIEVFTDAAFAFALTMLVISFDELPRDFDEFIQALKNIPTFAASFIQISMFWYAHHIWSRRYGLDDFTTAVLSFMLVFLTLIYVYPLRIVFSALFYWISDGYLPFELGRTSGSELGWIFVIYGVGFCLMSGTIALHYCHSLRQATALELDALERFCTRAEVQAYLLLTATGLASILVALLSPAHQRWHAGLVYFALFAIMPAFDWFKNRQRQRLMTAASA